MDSDQILVCKNFQLSAVFLAQRYPQDTKRRIKETTLLDSVLENLVLKIRSKAPQVRLQCVANESAVAHIFIPRARYLSLPIVVTCSDILSRSSSLSNCALTQIKSRYRSIQGPVCESLLVVSLHLVSFISFHMNSVLL